MGIWTSRQDFEVKPKHQFTTGDHGFHLSDLSISLLGNIAVSGYSNEGRTFIEVYHADDTDYAYCSMKFKEEASFLDHRRYISFMNDGRDSIVTCSGNTIGVIATQESKVLHLRHLDSMSLCSCITVREHEIFVALNVENSPLVAVFDNDLNKKNQIKPADNMTFPTFTDIALLKGRLFLSHADGAESWLEAYPSVLTRYENELSEPSWLKRFIYRAIYGSDIQPHTLTASENLGLVIVARYGNELALYPINKDKPFLVFPLGPDWSVQRIRISVRDLMVVTGNYQGEVKKFELKKIFTYDKMKKYLVSHLSIDDCRYLVYHLQIKGKDSRHILKNSVMSQDNLLSSLQEGGIIKLQNIIRLEEAIGERSSYYRSVVTIYRKIHHESSADNRERGRIREREVPDPNNAPRTSPTFPLPTEGMPTPLSDNGREPEISVDREDTTVNCPMSDCMEFLSNRLCQEWRQFGRNLGLSNEKLDQINADNTGNIRCIIYSILNTWKQRNGSRATFQMLAKALQKTERWDLAEEVCTYSTFSLI